MRKKELEKLPYDFNNFSVHTVEQYIEECIELKAGSVGRGERETHGLDFACFLFFSLA